MMYPYIVFHGTEEIGDIEVTHSHLLNRNGVQTVEVHFERATDIGFDTARCELPYYQWLIRDGFTDCEIIYFEEFLKNNAHLIFKFAEKGGISCA